MHWGGVSHVRGVALRLFKARSLACNSVGAMHEEELRACRGVGGML